MFNDIIRPASAEFTNDRAGARALCKWLNTLEKAHLLTVGIAMEATGIYSAQLYGNLLKVNPKLHVSICNPLAISHYMRATALNKTDKADAALIARYAEHFHPEAHQKASRDEETLKRLSRERAFLVDSCTEYRNHLENLQDSSDRKRIKTIIDTIQEQIKSIEKAMEKYVAEEASPECKNEIELMQTAPGVGRLSAAVIYGELGSLAGYTRKQLSAMSGVCPITLQSGTSLQKGGLSKKGSRFLRRILFLDVQQTIKKSPAMAEFHTRMLAKADSSKMSAKTACMRKLLLILRGMVISQKAFDPAHISLDPRKQEKTVKPA